ncbi:uncharacterized protein A1O5_00694 [Cladophialophora psammophila CBS 110553]|uniref:Amino acid permease/ SLC12A domain-containing protein n=1 Tax=Cladophialophora psammophila CBS 110553 TaxID=1182543 RepID=W9XGW1_9EURO|nr:uncharacterized protein A1O5_00694 [Cladophialophora psammophila CBS 110553]EXJ76186.1 hypothetical protein A1O5_00694 [Cladophialophora psammophila CBS 110553]
MSSRLYTYFSKRTPAAANSPRTKKETSIDVESDARDGTEKRLNALNAPPYSDRPPASSALVHTLTETKRQIGVISAFFLIFNRMVGTGIFATPSTIFSLAGSVGLSLFIWVAGMIIAMCGMAVYLEFGTAIPKNGGEKNYLEFVYRHPKYLATGFYTGYVVLLGGNQRGVGLACITAAFLIHGCALKWGLRLQNLLGIIKLIIVLLIVVSGWVPEPHNFENAFEGTTGSAYGVVTALYSVIWSYIGYSNANYALSETKNPVRTLKVAAPAAIIFVSIIYMLVNIAYFAAVPKEEIVSSGLVQELGREGILPFSRVWASNNPFNAPLAGLFEHWCVSVIIMLAPPPGDAYNFILNVISYPLSIINAFVAAGLLYLYVNPYRWEWSPPIRATWPVTLLFLLSNLYLIAAPFVPPSNGQNVYKDLPYYLHCVVGMGIIAAGGFYWLTWAVLLPRLGNYELVREVEISPLDGWERRVLSRRKITRDEKSRRSTSPATS